MPEPVTDAFNDIPQFESLLAEDVIMTEDFAPIENFKKKDKKDKKPKKIDTAALDPNDPWYCDPEVEGKHKGCPQPCDPEKYWCELPCKCPLNEKGKSPKYCDECPNPDKENNTLPVWLRLTAQIMGVFFEFHVVFLAIFPWWVLGIGIILSDFIWDWLWYGIFFAFCKPCAYVFIWILNVPMMFIHVNWWYQRFQLELVGFIVDFWTLFFGGDGCFCRWGQDCWFAKRIKEKDNMTWTDLVWLAVMPEVGYMGSPFLPQKVNSESHSILKQLGFPGTKDEFYDDMLERQKNVKGMLKSGNPAYNIFSPLWQAWVDHTNNFTGRMREIGFEW